MPIDNIAQLGLAQVRPAAPEGANPAPAMSSPARQELPAGGQAVPPPGSGEVRQAVSRLNEYVQTLRRDLQFRVDEDSDRVVVTVTDSESGEVIRQIPSEEALAVARSLENVQGLIFDRKA